MTEVLRPALYGAQHPLVLVTREVRGVKCGMKRAVDEAYETEAVGAQASNGGAALGAVANDGHWGSDHKDRYIIVGHCCESGDLLTPAPNEPEVLLARSLGQRVAIDDFVVVEGAGAYCSSMATKHYNSFPEAAEVLLDEKGAVHLIRRRQKPAEIWTNELPYAPS